MQVLITGGAGFVGRPLALALLAEGHQVRVLDSLLEQVHGPAARMPAELESAEFIQGDIRDSTDLLDALSGVDAVAHLAAETGVGQSMYDVERYVDVNDRGTARLLQAAAARGRPLRIVLASSRAVYGEGLYHCLNCGDAAPPMRDSAALDRADWNPCCPHCGTEISPVATHEGLPCQPGSVYAATKLAQEHLCRIVGAAYGFPVVILRYFNVYGPGQTLSNPYTGILSTFFTRAKSGKTIEVFEDGLETRDFIYIDDVVEATRRALLSPADGSMTHTLNVGTGVPTTLYGLADAIVRIGGLNAPICVTGGFRAGDVRHAFADTRRARAVLGFAAETRLADGLAKWIRWAQGCDYQDLTDAAASNLTARGLYRNRRG